MGSCIFFSASSGKLATYILPCFPPFAVLSAVGLVEYLKRGHHKLFNYGVSLNSLILLCVAAGLLVIQNMDVGFRAYGEDEIAKLILVTTLLFLGGAAGIAAVLATRLNIKLVSSLALIALPAFAIPFVVPNETTMLKSPGEQLVLYRDKINDESIVISDDSIMHAVSWYLKRDDIYLINDGEVSYGLEYPDASHRFLDRNGLKSLLQKALPGTSMLMACKRQCPEELTALLPPGTRKHVWGDFTFWFVPADGASDQASGAAH